MKFNRNFQFIYDQRHIIWSVIVSETRLNKNNLVDRLRRGARAQTMSKSFETEPLKISVNKQLNYHTQRYV